MEHAAHTKAILDKLALPCAQSHAPFRFRYEHGDWENSPYYIEICRSIAYAAYLGARQIIVHEVRVPEDVDYIDYNVAYLRSFEPIARRCGIKIAFENGPVPEIINRILTQLDSDLFICCLDNGHAYMPSKGNYPHEFVQRLIPQKLQALHVHDNYGLNDDFYWYGDLHMLPYTGCVDWDAFLRALAQQGYCGDFTFETVGYLDHLPVEVLPEALALAQAIGRSMIKRLESFKIQPNS